MTPTALPTRIDLADPHGAHLRPFTTADADALARAVDESLDHLRPWMAWAGPESAGATFQRTRLETVEHQFATGEEYQYGLFDRDESRVLGSFGLMTRQGPGTLELGYWVHVDATGRGLATAAAAALTGVALAVDGVDVVIICCDAANTRSAAIPRRLGYALDRVTTREPEAPGESGRLMVWVMRRQSS